MPTLPPRFASDLPAIEAALQTAADALYPSREGLHAACRYALDGQGKRIRPLLALAAAEAVGAERRVALRLGVALEMIHTYSLVHDDLPCLDNDDLRRGRPTVHKAFDEALALLAGDALLTDAFAWVSADTNLSAETRIRAVQKLSEAAGGRGMVLGQAFDMHWTGREGITREALDSIHLSKTAALIAASCLLGGLAGGANDQELAALEGFGRDLGLVFQIVDDLLDGREGTGKSQGKDLASGKLTYLRLMSEAEAQQLAHDLTERTLSQLTLFGEKADGLRSLARFLLERQN